MREFFDVRSFHLSGKTGLNVCYGIANGYGGVHIGLHDVKKSMFRETSVETSVSSVAGGSANGMGADVKIHCQCPLSARELINGKIWRT